MGRRATPVLLTCAFLTATSSARAEPTIAACTRAAEEGQQLRAAGRLLEARERFVACSTECPTIVRTDCARWATEVLEATPTIVVDARDPSGRDVTDVRVFVDDRLAAKVIDGRAIAVDPGSHVIRVERADGTVARERVVAKENRKGRQVFVVLGGGDRPEPVVVDEKRGGWKWQHWTGLTSIVVGTGLATYAVARTIAYTITEDALFEKFTQACSLDGNAECSPQERIRQDELRTDYNENEASIERDLPLVVGGAIGGAALLAGGIALLVLAPSSKSARAAPLVAPGLAGVGVSGSF